MIIVIMGILAAIVLPRFSNSSFINSLTLRSAASQITSDIRYTRQLAITNSGDYRIIFTFNRNEYAIYSVSGQNQVGETKKIPADIRCSGTSRFIFDYLGSCTPNNDLGLTLSLGVARYRITVEPPSGAVVVEKI